MAVLPLRASALRVAVPLGMGFVAYLGGHALGSLGSPPPPPAPEGRDRVLRAAEDLEQAMLSLERLHPGGVALGTPDSSHYQELDALFQEPTLSLRVRRLLRNAEAWFRVRHPPTRRPCCGELDRLPGPDLHERLVTLVQELTRDILQGDVRRTERSLAQGRVPELQRRFVHEVAAELAASVQRLGETWPRLPDQVAELMAMLAPQVWSPACHALILDRVRRLRELEEPGPRARVAWHLLELIQRVSRMPTATEEDLTAEVAALEAARLASPAAPWVVRFCLQVALVRVRGRLAAAGGQAEVDALRDRVAELVALCKQGDERWSPAFGGAVWEAHSHVVELLDRGQPSQAAVWEALDELRHVSRVRRGAGS